MTDHKAEAEDRLLEAMEHPDRINALHRLYAQASIHSMLHLAEVVEALGGSVDVVEAATFAGRSPVIPTVPVDRAVQDVAWERQKQVSQGWSAEHDLQNGPGHLAGLAMGYLTGVPAVGQAVFSHKTERQRLVIAAALLVAAVEVIDRREAGE